VKPGNTKLNTSGVNRNMSDGIDKRHFLPRADLQALLDALSSRGYECIGPVVREGTIRYLPISDTSQLPQGECDQQAPGVYRLLQHDHERQFAWANGPQGIKPLVFASEEVLWRCSRGSDGGLGFESARPATIKRAIIGARACDIAALYIQDKHFLQSQCRDPYYAARRQGLVIIAVNCSHPAATCFCASTGDGPGVTYGYDIALSELDDGFLVEARSQFGLKLLNQLPLQAASSDQITQAQDQIAAASQQQRALPSRNLYQSLFARLDHERWQQLEQRCLACGNCTSVCPTCFCHAENEQPSLDGNHSEHRRQWDSCFNADHSYIHGITIRSDTAQRYRQWLTHKLGSWHAQYGRSGCVGCGRCISWCPVGIDITEEVAQICNGEQP